MNSTKTNQPVSWEIREPGIAVLIIDRPERLNALNLAVKQEIEKAIQTLTAEDSVRVIIITGANNVFVAGTDVAEMVDMQAEDHQKLGTGKMFEVLRDCPKILIAAVERYALGGGMELALSCDMIIAGEDAQFAQPEIKVGIMPGAGGTQLLLRTLGKYRAMKLILSGERISATQAFEMGLLSEVVDSGKALENALTLAKTIARMPPLALTAIKQVITEGQNLPLSEALQNERQAFVKLFESEDQVEGMRAFLEKRAPEFKGK